MLHSSLRQPREDQKTSPSSSTYLEGIAVMDKHRVSFKLGGRPRFLTGDKPCPFGREPLVELALT